MQLVTFGVLPKCTLTCGSQQRHQRNSKVAVGKALQGFLSRKWKTGNVIVEGVDSSLDVNLDLAKIVPDTVLASCKMDSSYVDRISWHAGYCSK